MRVVRDYVEGIRVYWTGFRTWARDPQLMLLGLVPGIVTGAILVVLLMGMWLWLDDVGRWLASHLTDDNVIGGLLAGAFAFAIFMGTLVLVIYAFVSVTSVVGQPFFEALSHRVDDQLGPVPEGPEWPWWRNAVRGIGEGLRLFAVQAPLSLGIFLIGLIPVAGTVSAWILGLLVGSWFVTLEFTSIPFERRGMVLRERRKVLGSRRALTLGFGSMAFLMSIVPPIAVATMPGAVAAGTILARRALDSVPPPA